MSNCGYFKIHKGKVTCVHPENGEQYTRFGNARYSNLGKQCDWCRFLCGGIYPSQVPAADQTGWKQDIVDNKGNVID